MTRPSHIRRRELILGAAAAGTLARAAWAGADARPPRLAVFGPFDPAAGMQANGDHGYYRAFFAELRRLGYVEGVNLTVERYGKEQNIAGLVALAEAVVRSKPDVVYAIGPGVLELKASTTTIPLVTLSLDPIALGLTSSLAHPGGNITGVSDDAGPAIWGKRIELLREIFPPLSKPAFLGRRGAGWDKFFGPAVRAACAAARLPFVAALVDEPANEAAYRRAIGDAVRQGADAIMVADTTDLEANMDLVVGLIAEARLPAIYALAEVVEVGGLMSYAADMAELGRRAAADVDAILRGANPGDIPFFQVMTFVLSVNVKTAKALGLSVPPILSAQAAEVIE